MGGDGFSPSKGRLGVSAVTGDLRFWNHFYAIVFDDVLREVCDVGRSTDAELSATRTVTAEFLRRFSDPADADPDAALAFRVEVLLRGTLFLRFGDRVRYWLDHLEGVEAEYAWRMCTLHRRRATPADLVPFLDRPAVDGAPP